MSDLSPAIRLRRMRVLRLLAGASAPLTVSFIAARLGWSTPTVRTHLQGLLDAGAAVRVNYRRWGVPDGFNIRRFHANSL
jgi:predicted ArsR family transcriptional regulator